MEYYTFTLMGSRLYLWSTILFFLFRIPNLDLIPPLTDKLGCSCQVEENCMFFSLFFHCHLSLMYLFSIMDPYTSCLCILIDMLPVLELYWHLVSQKQVGVFETSFYLLILCQLEYLSSKHQVLESSNQLLKFKVFITQNQN